MKRAAMKLKDKFSQHVRDLYLLAAIASFSIGGFVAFLGNDAKNPILIVVGFAGLAGGVMLFRAWRSTGKIRIELAQVEVEGEVKTGPPNSLIIYRDKVAFANVEKPSGQAQKCYNDGKFYHVLKKDTEALEEFRLPDDDESERYYDPSEFANPVTMPSNKRYFTWSISTMQKISVGLMAIVIAGEIIGIIALGG